MPETPEEFKASVISLLFELFGVPPGKIRTLIQEVDQISVVVNGDPEVDTIGLRHRVKELEEFVEQIRGIPTLIKGIGLGLAFNGLAILVQFIISLVQLLRSP